MPTREYVTTAVSTDIFGRMISTIRDHHIVVDGPVQNGCPGVAVTPAELFLAGIGNCAVELVQVIARETDTPVGRIETEVRGALGAGANPHPAVTLFDSVTLTVRFTGAAREDAERLVTAFKAR